jgi:hypothetical protein
MLPSPSPSPIASTIRRTGDAAGRSPAPSPPALLAHGTGEPLLTDGRQKVQTPEERRAARVLAMKDHSFRCGVLTAMAMQTLPTLASALAQIRRHNRRGGNDRLITELENHIKRIEDALDDMDEADREIHQRLGLASWRE